MLFLVLALIGVFPGQVLVTWGTRMSLASNAALLMQALTVCTAILAVLLLGERLTAMAVAGEILGLASTMLITLWEELQKPNPLKG